MVMCSVEGAIDRDHGGESRAEFFHQRANAAKISLAFFADVACEHDRLRRSDARFGECARHADQRSETRAVIGDAGSFQALALRFTVTLVPAGNTVSRCAASKMTPFVSEPGRSPITLPILSTRTRRPLASKRFSQCFAARALL